MNFHIFHFGDRYPKNSNEEIFIHLVLWMWMFSQMSLWYNAQSGNPSKITSNPFLCWESCNWISVCGTVNCLGTYHWSRSSSNSAIKIGSVAVWGFPGKFRVSFCKRIKPGCGSCEIAIHYYLKETAIMRPAYLSPTKSAENFEAYWTFNCTKRLTFEHSDHVRSQKVDVCEWKGRSALYFPFLCLKSAAVPEYSIDHLFDHRILLH